MSLLSTCTGLLALPLPKLQQFPDFTGSVDTSSENIGERANQAQLCLSPDTGTRKWKVSVLVQTHSLPFHNCGKILPTCAACRHTFSSFHFNGEEKLQEP